MAEQPLHLRFRVLSLALLVIGAGLAPPLLDAAERDGTAHIEGQHDPSTCRHLHDHAACAQLAKSPLQGSEGWRPLQTLDASGVLDSAPVHADGPHRTDQFVPSPRAPPSDS